MDWLSVDLNGWQILLFMVVGILTGIINTLAGSGSLITLPIFIFMCDLSPSVANGSNRIGVFLQSLVATNKYVKEKPGLFNNSWGLFIPSIIGSLIGSKIAVDIDEKTMNYTIGFLMVFMLFLLILKPEKWLIADKKTTKNELGLLSIATYFFIGFYGGFLQAGVGFFLMAGLVLVSKYSLSQSNGLKLALVLAFTAPALLLFMYYGKIHYGYGILMGIFQSIGAWLGVNYITKIPNANTWIYRLLIVIVFASAIKFFI
jgi:uncharacterized membrane protein YfcA